MDLLIGGTFVLMLFSIQHSHQAPLAFNKPETSFHTLTVCRGQMRSIACPNIQLLHIYNAFYGKLSGHDCQDPVTQLRDQIPTCFSRDAPRIIREACQGQQSCDLYAEDSLYNDPCPSVNKYLFVSFTCQGKSDLPEKLKMFEDDIKAKDLLPGKLPLVEGNNLGMKMGGIIPQPSKKMSAVVCSGQTGSIYCPSLQLLHIQSANFGKEQGRDCLGKVTRDTIPTCFAHDAIRTVKDMCDGQQSCDLFSEAELYGRTLCDAHTQKYLHVEYTCDGHSNLELQLKHRAQSFVYQPQETPQNPFLRSTIPYPPPFNPWTNQNIKSVQIIRRSNIPQYKGWSNQQLADFQRQRMAKAKSLIEQNELRRKYLLQKQQQAAARNLQQQRARQIQEAARARSLQYQRQFSRYIPQQPPNQMIGAQRQNVQYQAPPQYPVVQSAYPLPPAPAAATFQLQAPMISPQIPIMQPQAPVVQPQIPMMAQSAWQTPLSDYSKDASVRNFFGYRHSTCEQCNGDCKNYLCYGCGGCQEPPPEQQTYYYPYQRQDAAYHDAFIGNEMALSGLVIWPLPKMPWKKPKEEEKKGGRSKVEEDSEDEDEDEDDDDENTSGEKAADVNKKAIKTQSI